MYIKIDCLKIGQSFFGQKLENHKNKSITNRKTQRGQVKKKTAVFILLCLIYP